jgi:hypothetical protein
MIHDGFWIFKFIIICGAYFGIMFIPNSIFVVWAHICRAGSFIFVSIQSYFWLNASYGMNDKLIDMFERGSPNKRKIAKWTLILTSAIITLINVAWLGLMIYWAGTCPINLTIVVVTALFFVFFYIISLVKLCNVNIFRRNATIFTISLASNYVIYLCWTAMSSNEDCLPYDAAMNSVA